MPRAVLITKLTSSSHYQNWHDPYSIYYNNYQHQLCIPWVARLCLTVVSCWKCLYKLVTPQAFTCARTRKESISCRSTDSAKRCVSPKAAKWTESENSIWTWWWLWCWWHLVAMMMIIIIIKFIIIIIIIIIVVVVIIVIIVIIIVLDLLSFQGSFQKTKQKTRVPTNDVVNEWVNEGRKKGKKYERMPCEMDDLLNNWCQYWFWSSSQLWSAGCTCLALNKSRCSLSTSSLSWERNHSLKRLCLMIFQLTWHLNDFRICCPSVGQPKLWRVSGRPSHLL